MLKKTRPSNFIYDMIEEDLKEGGRYYGKTVHTRFPPEPNGYLHIGHAKAIYIDFMAAKRFSGKCNLRFDDTNPVKEEVEYVEAIKRDVKWLGFNWDGLFYASDYFEMMYESAIKLINKGLAYVCDLNSDEIREYRGTLTEAGKNSPYRNRTIEENLDLFKRMRAGEFEEGKRVLRAKIDMSSPNINMRDPVIYRILHEDHHRTKDAWCIYPMYDFAHPLEDAFEGITHSLCDLGFKNHRPLYDWFVKECGPFDPAPCQTEFARLNISNTVMSKRHLKRLVDANVVPGWDDPRLPTLGGLRRRGYTPEAILNFIEAVGVSTSYSVAEHAMLEYYIREDLNKEAQRAMAVLDPIKLIIDNYDEALIEEFDAQINPSNKELGTRKVAFSKELYIERDDFMKEPVKGYFRLYPGNEVRLKYAYYVTCTSYETDDEGNVTCVHATYDPESRGGWLPTRKVRGTIHWVSCHDAVKAEVRLYDKLFLEENPLDESDGVDLVDKVNPDSLTIIEDAYVEPYLAKSEKNLHYQFLRLGYFSTDDDHKEDRPVFNRTVSLRDSWSKKVN